MKKFEQHLREKAHLNKIKNAKQTVPLPSKHSSRGGNNKGDEAQLLLKLYDNKSYDSIPAYKLLRTAGLQQYTRGFIERGYGINLSKLSTLNQKDRQKLYDDLKIMPGHTVKLDNLISTLTHYTLDKDSNIFEQSQKYSHSGHSQSDAGRSQYSNRNSVIRSGIKPPKGDLSKHSVKDDSQYERQLERVLNQYTPVIDDKKKRTFNDRISQKNSVNLAKDSQKYAKTRYNPTSSIKIGSEMGNQFKKKATTPMESKPTVKRNSSITGKVSSIKKSEKTSTAGTVSGRGKSSKNVDIGVSEELKGKHTYKIMEINLDLKSIKSLFRSFDGAQMSSTIANIDIEELVYAFSGLVQHRVIAAPQPQQNINLQATFNKKKRNDTFEEAVVDAPDRYMEQSIEDQVGAILRQSYMHPLYRDEQNIQEQIDDLNNQDEVQSEEDQEQEEEQESQLKNKTQNQFMDTKNLGESSFLGGQSYDFGLQNKLDIFNEPNPNQLDYFKPTIDSISNFIKNIVLAAKMERQISIMAAYYLETFLNKTKIQLTSLNYKRILVTVLLLASKIWDDESFESPSFSRTFPEYNTILLNEMEKQLLKVLDYRLKLDKKEYAQIFFRMRNYAKKNFRSCQNKRMNLKQIRQLQLGQRKQYKTQFMGKRNSF